MLSREERDVRKRAWYRARSCSFGTFVFGPFRVVMHFFFVIVCLFVLGGTNDNPGSLGALGDIRHDQSERNSIYKRETCCVVVEFLFSIQGDSSSKV